MLINFYIFSDKRYEIENNVQYHKNKNTLQYSFY